MTELKEHYAAPNLIERIDQALVAAGKSPDSLQLADLTPIDEFHLRGPVSFWSHDDSLRNAHFATS